jgi:hypothetical protein
MPLLGLLERVVLEVGLMDPKLAQQIMQLLILAEVEVEVEAAARAVPAWSSCVTKILSQSPTPAAD